MKLIFLFFFSRIWGFTLLIPDSEFYWADVIHFPCVNGGTEFCDFFN
uniref:Uncharacterized protein n=1 Tax=Phakopsora pachyrhizi TaxID=170000 RepID=A0A0S1MJL6_PHAPC